jgi:hypothetical protein
MPTVADYAVLTDAPFTHPAQAPPGDQHLQFNAPGVSPSSPSVLAFRVNPHVHNGNVTLRMRLNDAAPLMQEFDTEPQRSWHEVFPAGVVKASGNELVVSVPSTSGGGSIDVSDIVIFFQVDIGRVLPGDVGLAPT